MGVLYDRRGIQTKVKTKIYISRAAIITLVQFKKLYCQSLSNRKFS